jgi:lipoate-protein ligase A
MAEQLNLIHLENNSIFDQLLLEEALLRGDDRNFCIINRGSPPAIVMGISGKPEKLIDRQRYEQNPIPLIRRFSGGGTVVIDSSTLFITFIFNKADTPLVNYPNEIMQWTEQFYRPIFPTGFMLRENDYVIGNRKFGGNAQSITKNRWLHHTSLLWSFNPHLMQLLTIPEKRPEYRQSRDHLDFLMTLDAYYGTPEELIEALKTCLSNQFELQDQKIDRTELLNRDYRKTTALFTVL